MLIHLSLKLKLFGAPLKDRSLEPDWSQEPCFHFLIYHERQDVALSIFDANVLRQDVRLASLPSTTVADLVARCARPRWLELDAEKSAERPLDRLRRAKLYQISLNHSLL